MLTNRLLLVLIATTELATSTWLPVREWVHGPIPGLTAAKVSLRTPNCCDSLDISLQHSRDNHHHATEQTNADLSELIIQFNQDNALNLVPEVIASLLHRPPLPFEHILSLFTFIHIDHHGNHDKQVWREWCHWDNLPTIKSPPQPDTPFSRIVTRYNLHSLCGHANGPPLPFNHRHYDGKSSGFESTQTHSHLGTHHTLSSIAVSIARIMTSNSFLHNHTMGTDHTPSTQDNNEAETQAPAEVSSRARMLEVHINSSWCLTSVKLTHQRSSSRTNRRWFFHRRTLEHPFIHCDYHSISTRAFGPITKDANLRRIKTVSNSILYASLRLMDSGLTLLLGYPTLVISSIPSPMVALFLFSFLPVASSAGDDDDLKIKLQPFDGVVANFTSWLISFSAWIAWKKPELMALLNGSDDQQPSPAVADAPTPNERKRIKEWLLYNTQLYGAIVTHVTSPIQASLHVNSTGDGVKALSYLKKRYGSQSTGDRAEATLRLQKSYIDARAKISAEDVIRQYNEMSFAADDIVAAGGTRPDDILLISMFENSLPSSYAMIRQMIRYSEHQTFDAYYNDLLSQVKAEYRVNEARSTAGAFAASGKGDRGKGKGVWAKGKAKGKGGGKGKGGRGKGDSYSYHWSSSYANPCFNCSSFDHLREGCPNQPTRCKHCGANHTDELCPRGPGGPLRDGLSPAAYEILEKQCNRTQGGKKRGYDDTNAYTSTSSFPSTEVADEVFRRAYLMGRSSALPHSTSDVGQSTGQCAVQPPSVGSSSAHSARQAPASSHPRSSSSHGAGGSTNRFDIDEIDQWLEQAAQRWAHMAYESDERIQPSSLMSSRGVIAYIDSQATNFVVPSVDYLTTISDHHPTIGVDTANGRVQPEAIGVFDFDVSDDHGEWHHFTVSDVWVLPTCDRVLYSQRQMRELGVQHHLDNGYLTMPNGSRRSVSSRSYTIEITMGAINHSTAYSSSSLPLLRSVPVSPSRPQRGRGADSKAQVPQSLVWQRLGFPSKHTWLHTMEAVIDHGLPDHAHLKHDFAIPEAVVAARSRLLPFHSNREADSLPAPGSIIYMDFAGPVVESYPHKFKYYCGAVDAGSGYSRIVACHSPDKEIARQCLELLLADLKMLMGVSHKLSPQFMSYYFRDFLSSEQMRHWPSVTYTPQQNATVERMWGSRFGIARTLLKFARLGPSWHTFALQTANWICNRLPQVSRNNMSPWYILSKQRASIAYLRSFGCLVRFVIPTAHRSGDRHFADRGATGIYLGPSEVSPGCIVYSPSLRRMYTTRDVICFEDVHPGVKGCDNSFSWPDALETPTPMPVTDPRIDPPQPSATVPSSSSLPPESVSRVIAESHVLDTDPPDDIDLTQASSDLPSHAPSASIPNEDIVRDDDTHHRDHDTTAELSRPRKLPKHDSGDINDPSSRLFERRLPDRSTRHRTFYVCPTSATSLEAVSNFLFLALEMNSQIDSSEILVYESAISEHGTALIVASTADMGDLVIPLSYEQAVASKEREYWKAAIQRELNGLIELGTFEYVRLADVPPNSNIMRCHMVFTVKRLEDGRIDKFKCRLVANGSTQRWGVDFDRVFSTVAKIATLRLVLAIAAGARDYNLSSIDIRQAYLQATLSEDLYMAMPPSLPEYDSTGCKLVVKLRKSLYGLKQAGREWGQLLTKALLAWGMLQSAIDPCLFTYSTGGSILWVVVWVDDCVICDNDPKLRSRFVSYLSETFPVDDKGDLNWILHVRIQRDRRSKRLSMFQDLYVKDLLTKFGGLLDGLTRRFDSPCDASQHFSSDQCPDQDSVEYAQMSLHRRDYMSLVGAYLWLANVTRPELSYIAGQLARFVSNPSMLHYRAALRVLLYLKSTQAQGLDFQPRGSETVRCFVDSNWSSEFSVSGGVIDYMGFPVHWFSRTQKSVSMSSTEAEYFAACVAAREVLFVRELATDLSVKITGPTVINTDNKGVVDLSFDPVAFKKTKHILRAAHFVRDLVLRCAIKLEWICGKDNPVDIFTKSHELATFRRVFRILMNLKNEA